MQKLDKKQMPQFVGLCVLSTGVFGYFGVRMVTPSPAAAATRPVPKPVNPAAAPGAIKAPAALADTAPEAAVVPPPAPGMRDPFLVGYTDPKSVKAAAPAGFSGPPPAPAAGTQVADAQIHEQVASLPPAPVSSLMVPGFPTAPPLPSALPPSQKIMPAQKIMPLPAPPPAPPKWSVTGLLQSEDGGGVAILRDGDSRRFVRVGDFVDGVFRVASVTRSSVVLRHGMTFYTLPLSAATEKSQANSEAKPQVKPQVKPEAVSAPAAPAPAAPAPPAPMLPRQSLAASTRRLTAACLPGSLPLHLLDGTEMNPDAPAQKVASCLR